MSDKLFYIGNFGEKLSDTETYIREAEMFSTGIHRGVEYTEDDITQLVNEFNAEDEVPVQIDHSESALHTVGYLREAFSKEGKLMGKLEILDEKIQERVEKGLMKKLSVSFYLKHSEDGMKPHKLREVSLVAFPQVKGARLFSENGYVSEYKEEEDENMTKVDLSEIKAELKKELETEIHEQYSELEKEVETLRSEKQNFTELQVQTKVEKFQEENKVVPAQAEALGKLLGSFSEEQASLFDEFMKNNKTVDLSETGEFSEQDGEQDTDERTQEQKDFDKFYEEYSQKHGASL